MRLVYDDQRSADLERAQQLIAELEEIENRQPYWIRQGLSVGLIKDRPAGVGFNATFSDANHPDGGRHVTLSPEDRDLLEPQFLGQAALNRADTVLAAWREYLCLYSKKSISPWSWVGNLYLDPPLSRRSKGGIRKAGDELMGIAALGLTMSLSAFFRLVSENKVPHRRCAGTEYPKDGKPNWPLVADYLTLVFNPSEPFSSDECRQRFYSLTKNHSIRLHNWPEEGRRKAQIVN